jgi:pyruvate/2-oxoglutarate dehydrogenase complex dihydrolipoamide acyltransferase (E2) component
MKTLRINADEVLWRNSMLPEGVLERWLVADGDTAHAGHAIAQVRIEGALHDIVSPATGRLTIAAPRLSVVDPGFLLATIAVGAEAPAEA